MHGFRVCGLMNILDVNKAIRTQSVGIKPTTFSPLTNCSNNQKNNNILLILQIYWCDWQNESSLIVCVAMVIKTFSIQIEEIKVEFYQLVSASAKFSSNVVLFQQRLMCIYCIFMMFFLRTFLLWAKNHCKSGVNFKITFCAAFASVDLCWSLWHLAYSVKVVRNF